MAHLWQSRIRTNLQPRAGAAGFPLSVLGLLAAMVLAPLARGETLLEVYQLAYQNDSKYRAAQAESRASGTAIDQARAGYLPTVRLDIEKISTYQKILSTQNAVFATGSVTFPTDNKTLLITQPIFRKDVIERFAQSKAVVRQAGLTLLASEQELLLRTTSAYLSVLAATDSVALAAAERQAVGKALDLARERLKMGLGTVTNEYDSAARFAVAQAREIEAQNKLADAKQGLREITSKLASSFQSLRDEFVLAAPNPASVESWVETALAQNLSLRARTEAVEVARQEVKRQQAAHYPSLNLVFTHNRRESGGSLFGGGSDVANTDVMLRLTVPIYEGGLTTAVTREAVHRLERTEEELELERRAVERAARAAYEGTLSGIGLVRALRQSVTFQESALEAKDVGLKAGRFTLLAVLDAQRDLYLAKRDYAQSRYDYLLNVLKLKQAAGTLAEADLALVHAALQ